MFFSIHTMVPRTLAIFFLSPWIGAARSEQEKQETDLSDDPAKLEKSIRNYTRELSYSAYVRKDHVGNH